MGAPCTTCTLTKRVSKIISQYSKITDPGMLQGTIQYAYDFVEKIPLVEREAFQNTIDEIAERRPDAKQAKPERFYDKALVQELRKEAFFKNLWGKICRPKLQQPGS